MRLNVYVEQFVAQAMQPFRQADVDMDGLDSGDLTIARRQVEARDRGARASIFMSADLDADGVVTAEERALATPPFRRLPTARAEDGVLARFDGDGDGRVTLQEALAASVPPQSPSRESVLEVFMTFDADNDGRVTAIEAETALRRIFADFDANGDGLIDFDEGVALSQAAKPVRQAATCELPRAGADQQIVAFGLYEGDAVPSATVVGQDTESTTAEVVIEEGDTPLYLVLTSYDAMIWRVTGAKDRVARLVLSSSQSDPAKKQNSPRPSAAGAVGLPAEKVTVAPHGCLGSFHEAGSAEEASVRAAIRQAAGRTPDAIAGAYDAITVTLPAMTAVKAKTSSDPDDAPAGFDPQTWRDAVRFAPGGVVEIDPAAVVSGAPAVSYEVLPQQIGLAKLVGEGAIERAGGRFRIVKPIPRLPAGLSGAHAVRFSLAPGVPRPKGASGHSCVVAEGDPKAALGRGVCLRP
ncbi:Ca2+-binding EF-hand superfamily protein [Methylopila jiangsuensis]|nr:EF-hand domain-containing protein [Methylopila jiangsuensis]MDR6286424.1 Ca2+-binding EF-hand superfamily protein [Methylopila jiangsuensis]